MYTIYKIICHTTREQEQLTVQSMNSIQFLPGFVLSNLFFCVAFCHISLFPLFILSFLRDLRLLITCLVLSNVPPKIKHAPSMV